MHTSPQVPLLTSATQVADWLDASYPHAVNGAALARIEDHLGGTIEAMRLWSAGVRIIDNRPDNDPQGATCPDCGRHTRKIDGQYEAHTIPGVYDRLCHQGGK